MLFRYHVSKGYRIRAFTTANGEETSLVQGTDVELNPSLNKRIFMGHGSEVIHIES